MAGGTEMSHGLGMVVTAHATGSACPHPHPSLGSLPRMSSTGTTYHACMVPSMPARIVHQTDICMPRMRTDEGQNQNHRIWDRPLLSVTFCLVAVHLPVYAEEIPAPVEPSEACILHVPTI